MVASACSSLPNSRDNYVPLRHWRARESRGLRRRLCRGCESIVQPLVDAAIGMVSPLLTVDP